ncbi:putative RNA-directed DNA polymerase from transposon X-element [Trichonephila clavata]|uniref:Putative RNA-directed DNA polymerase from transposon X-element n=1 Tax=Trichonephila clavata TaxID=2740835 RepID=A0A8X6F833_TRICU|nr:putative RNA-directed DNA polymerase from transposon X-element [Trichonephila clavata]
MVSRKTEAPMPLFMLSMESSEQHKSIFQNVTSIGFVKVIVEILRKKYGPPQCYRCQGFFHSSKFCTRTPRCVKCAGNHLAKECKKELNDKPKCCLCGGEHKANFLGCPKNPKLRIEAEKERKQQQKSARIVPVPEPPMTNYWEQRAKNATPRQQSFANTQPGPSTVPPPPIHKNNSQEDPTDIFAQLKNPAVQETFDLLEQFITIATTIPSKGRPSRGGGTAILIKRNIPHHEIRITNSSFEITAIQIVRPNSQPITVISAYRPPLKSLLVQDLHLLFRNRDYVLVAGDLNAKHHSWNPLTHQNFAGQTIRRFCDSTGFSLNAPLEPTHFHNRLNNTIIDLAICKGMTVTEVTSIPELSSDHNPVLFEVSLDNFTSPALSTYAFPNWFKFQNILSNTLPGNPKISNINEIDDAIINFNSTFKNAFNNSSAFKSINKLLSAIPSVIREKIKLKNRLRKD